MHSPNQIWVNKIYTDRIKWFKVIWPFVTNLPSRFEGLVMNFRLKVDCETANTWNKFNCLLKEIFTNNRWIIFRPQMYDNLVILSRFSSLQKNEGINKGERSNKTIFFRQKIIHPITILNCILIFLVILSWYSTWYIISKVYS